jgi:hypothetical protein
MYPSVAVAHVWLAAVSCKLEPIIHAIEQMGQRYAPTYTLSPLLGSMYSAASATSMDGADKKVLLATCSFSRSE